MVSTGSSWLQSGQRGQSRVGQDGFEQGTQDFVAMLESRLTGAGEESDRRSTTSMTFIS